MGTSLGGSQDMCISFKAESDLSARQYRMGRITASDTFGTSYISGTDYVVGVLQNKPDAAGQPADVFTAVGGVTKVVTGGTIAAGALFICGTDARAITPLAAAGASTVFCGIALEASTATAANGGGDIISVLWRPTIGTTS
jgi:hypothetical protein